MGRLFDVLPDLFLQHVGDQEKHEQEADHPNAELLALELRYISELELDFDLELTGFEMAEIDLLLDPAGGAQDTLDRLPEADGPPVSAPGETARRARGACAAASRAPPMGAPGSPA